MHLSGRNLQLMRLKILQLSSATTFTTDTTKNFPLSQQVVYGTKFDNITLRSIILNSLIPVHSQASGKFSKVSLTLPKTNPTSSIPAPG